MVYFNIFCVIGCFPYCCLSNWGWLIDWGCVCAQTWEYFRYWRGLSWRCSMWCRPIPATASVSSSPSVEGIKRNFSYTLYSLILIYCFLMKFLMTTYFGRQASKGLKLGQKPDRFRSTTDRYRSTTDRFRSTTDESPIHDGQIPIHDGQVPIHNWQILIHIWQIPIHIWQIPIHN